MPLYRRASPSWRLRQCVTQEAPTDRGVKVLLDDVKLNVRRQHFFDVYEQKVLGGHRILISLAKLDRP